MTPRARRTSACGGRTAAHLVGSCLKRDREVVLRSCRHDRGVGRGVDVCTGRACQAHHHCPVTESLALREAPRHLPIAALPIAAGLCRSLPCSKLVRSEVAGRIPISITSLASHAKALCTL